MTDKDDNKPPEGDPPENVKPTNEDIASKLHDALAADESLTDDDRRSIAEGLNEKAGGKPTPAVAPESDHWTKRKLW